RDGNGQRGTSVSENSPEISEHVLVSPHGSFSTVGGRTPSGLHGDRAAAPSISQGADKQEIVVSDAEKLREHEAATKAQAAVRGYLARRAFRALKGIIRLQALIRGHLVRRQAVATLRTMRAIIKFQAVVRGRGVRSSTIVRNVSTKNWQKCPADSESLDAWKEKLSKNAFVCTLLSSPTLMRALHVKYHPDNPNSVFSWLERWTKARVWARLPQFKKAVGLKQRARRANYATATKTEKLKRNPRKLASSPTDTVQENPENEIKVKRNLRKLLNSKIKMPDHPEQSNDNLLKVKKKSAVTPENKPGIGTAVISETGKVQIDSSTNVQGRVEPEPLHSIGNDDKALAMNEALSSNEEQPSSESQRTGRRKSSYLAKSDYSENGLQNVPILPSYMAATESAKAKFRGQVSPQFDDSADKNGNITRRHSLPSSVHGSLNSNSPSTQKLVQASGNSGVKSDRSLSLSGDGCGKESLQFFSTKNDNFLVSMCLPIYLQLGQSKLNGDVDVEEAEL
ncbi:Protein IQ-DOMAIN 31, partial [Ananas comosus]